jgi:hypothetical protein
MAAGTYLPIVPFSANIYERGTVSLPEKASQTFKRGAPVIFNAGYVEEAGAAPATVRFIAAEDAHNGGVYGIVKDGTTGFWYVDDGDGGDQVEVVRRVETPSLGAVGDTKWRGIVKFQQGNIASA